MRRRTFLLAPFALSVLGQVGPAFAAPPEVRMYGASWCGPCRTVKAFLEKVGVPFRYLDVDEAANLDAFRRESTSSGIPFIVVGADKVRGANLPALLAALERNGHVKGVSLQPKVGTGGESYGGHSTGWWQSQFRELREQIAATGVDIDRRARTAQDSTEKGYVERLKDKKKMLEASLDQLENDASNVSLPRSFRQ